MNDLEKAKQLFFEAVRFCNIADYANAESRLRKALRLAPGHPAILTNLSTVALRREKFDEARKLAETALAADRNNVEALMVLTGCQVRKGQFADALAGCDRIIALEPRIAEVHSNRGNTLGHLKRHEEALAAFDMALRLQPDLAEARLGRGNTLFIRCSIRSASRGTSRPPTGRCGNAGGAASRRRALRFALSTDRRPPAARRAHSVAVAADLCRERACRLRERLPTMRQPATELPMPPQTRRDFVDERP